MEIKYFLIKNSANTTVNLCKQKLNQINYITFQTIVRPLKIFNNKIIRTK